MMKTTEVRASVSVALLVSCTVLAGGEGMEEIVV